MKSEGERDEIDEITELTSSVSISSGAVFVSGSSLYPKN